MTSSGASLKCFGLTRLSSSRSVMSRSSCRTTRTQRWRRSSTVSCKRVSCAVGSRIDWFDSEPRARARIMQRGRCTMLSSYQKIQSQRSRDLLRCCRSQRRTPCTQRWERSSNRCGESPALTDPDCLRRLLVRCRTASVPSDLADASVSLPEEGSPKCPARAGTLGRRSRTTRCWSISTGTAGVRAVTAWTVCALADLVVPGGWYHEASGWGDRLGRRTRVREDSLVRDSGPLRCQR